MPVNGDPAKPKPTDVEKAKLRIVALREGLGPYNGVRLMTPADRRKATRAVEAAETLRKRTATIEKAVDELMELKNVDLRKALSDPAKWAAAREQIASAAESIGQLQEAVGRLVPA
jgi:hypothetical protein